MKETGSFKEPIKTMAAFKERMNVRRQFLINYFASTVSFLLSQFNKFFNYVYEYL